MSAAGVAATLPIWTALAVSAVSTIAEAKKVAKKLKNSGNPEGRWKWAKNPGDGVNYAVFQCNAHKDCDHQIMVRKQHDGFGFKEKGEHAKEAKLKRRVNSTLGFDDEEMLKKEVDAGAKPAGIFSSMTKAKMRALVDEGEDPLSSEHKNETGGLKGTITICISDVLVHR